MKLALSRTISLIGILTSALGVDGQPARITVAVDQPTHKIPSTLWGVFFEDINLSADGGMYPELVRNRSFEDGDKPQFWKVIKPSGAQDILAIDSSAPLNPHNPHCLRVNVSNVVAIANEGYWGMNIVKGEGYVLKLAARTADDFQHPLKVKLVSASGKELATGEITSLTKDWQYHTTTLVAQDSDSKATLQIEATGNGILFLDMVSLLPKQTWKNHGLRPDLAESIQALRPAFFRFPGGCWVEGEDRAHMYNWKKTIGDVDQRVPLWNIWGYYATHGLGYHEYLQFSEDLGAEPLFCVNVGMSHKETIPMNEMSQWVHDALDAIEYANGEANTYWGAHRAAAGHPKPFNLNYVEIGNENGGPAYAERWALLANAIHAKYPTIKLIVNHWLGGYPSTPKADIVDEHYYDTPEWFMRNATRYDEYNRKEPKVFVGEYAVTRNCGLGNLRGALGEAAFMTGLERNSDHVVMASYAPLLVNFNHRAWNPDLINFDSSRWYGLPSYYVQKMFAENRGDVSLPTAIISPRVEPETPRGMIGVGTWRTAAEFKNIKVASPDGRVLFTDDFSDGTNRWKFRGGGDWKVANGALRQTTEKEFVRALAGDRNWTNYTLTLQARKLSGAEGFLIFFHIRGDEDRIWWNIGGWGNTGDGVEAGEILGRKAAKVETDRWYDLKIVVTGNHVQCYKDGKLEHDVDYDIGADVASLYACASKDETTGDIILKVVNANSKPLETRIDCNGGTNLTGKGAASILTSKEGTDENSLEKPMNVSPKTVAMTFTGASFTYAFPGDSFTVLRLKTKP